MQWLKLKNLWKYFHVFILYYVQIWIKYNTPDIKHIFGNFNCYTLTYKLYFIGKCILKIGKLFNLHLNWKCLLHLKKMLYCSGFYYLLLKWYRSFIVFLTTHLIIPTAQLCNIIPFKIEFSINNLNIIALLNCP